MSLQVVYATQLIERSEGFCENKNRLPYGNFTFVGVRQRPANGKQYFRQWHNARRLVKTPPQAPVNRTGTPVVYNDYIRQAASNYGVDETLIKAIIQVESGFNPNVVSTSNAVGLMQLKASTAGRDAYRMKGRSGQPSSRELKDPAVNIDLGTAYINILQSQQLADQQPTDFALCHHRFVRERGGRHVAHLLLGQARGGQSHQSDEPG